MTVNINGGTVNVISKEGKGGFLGGMHSVVNVTGGTVTLDKNSVLGMTEEQQTALKNYYTSNNMRLENFCKINISKGTVEGEAVESDTNGDSISAPYGNVMISGAETAVKVYNCMAYCGEISISDASGKKYTNPYTGDDRLPGHGNLSICIANRLSAKNLTIDKSSVVYSTNANEITVTVEKQGLLGAFSNSTVADQTVTISAGNNPESIDVIIPAEAGTYRVRFSINKDSGDDDVFYTFIVE